MTTLRVDGWPGGFTLVLPNLDRDEAARRTAALVAAGHDVQVRYDDEEAA